MSPTKRYRSVTMNAFVCFVFVVFALIAVSGWVAGPDEASAGAIAIWSVIGSLSLVVAVRALWAGVVASDAEVVLRGYFRTRRLAWDAVRRFRADDSGALVSGRILSIERVDGKQIRFPELWSLSFSRRRTRLVDVVVSDLNSRIGLGQQQSTP